tara:strand:+ start:554 stop:874 length:321 start_codon:yes stop_codon:yes gene_type:complete
MAEQLFIGRRQNKEKVKKEILEKIAELAMNYSLVKGDPLKRGAVESTVYQGLKGRIVVRTCTNLNQGLAFKPKKGEMSSPYAAIVEVYGFCGSTLADDLVAIPQNL